MNAGENVHHSDRRHKGRSRLARIHPAQSIDCGYFIWKAFDRKALISRKLDSTFLVWPTFHEVATPEVVISSN